MAFQAAVKEAMHKPAGAGGERSWRGVGHSDKAMSTITSPWVRNPAPTLVQTATNHVGNAEHSECSGTEPSAGTPVANDEVNSEK